MKKFLVLIMGILMSVVVFAHSPLISVDDNGDGTVYKDKAYNGPEESFKGKEIIYKGKLDAKNSLTIPKPATEKYEVYFNAGEGHVVSKKGPTLTAAEKANWDKATASFDFGEWKELMLEK